MDATIANTPPPEASPDPEAIRLWHQGDLELDSSWPADGQWTTEDYARLSRRGVELVDGRLEFLPMPDFAHQGLFEWLYRQIGAVVGWQNVRTSGYPLETINGRQRLPDLMASCARDGWGPKFATTADLVAEVVSPGSEAYDRDYNQKRTEYAAAGVGEYWIIDPQRSEVIVLGLADEQYEERSRVAAADGGVIESAAVPGLTVDVAEWFREAGPE